MRFEYTVYDVTVTTLTPLHIGSGRTLLNEYDYTIHQNNVWRINEDALLEAQDVDDPRLVETLSRTPPAHLLTPADYRPDSPYFRYRLAGMPRARGTGAQLQELLKTIEDEAYLPGSSLKGAIRTALVWRGWIERGLRPDRNQLERNRKFAARNIEKNIMGPDPNYDLLRALHVSDSEPAGRDYFLIVNAQVVTRGSLASPIELEAVKPDTAFHLTIKADRQLFSQWATRHRLRLGGNVAWLDNLPHLIQKHTQQRLTTELEWYKNRRGAEGIASFYQRLLGARLPANACLLQVGWGTGWEGKTLGSHLQADRRFMDYLIGTYRLAKGDRHPGDPFPKSRRVTVQVVKDQRGKTKQRLATPLGWVLMEMKERR